MADNVKSKSLFSALMTFFVTVILFTCIGAFVFDLVTAGSPGITHSTDAWGEKAARSFLLTIKAVEGIKQ